MSRITFPLLLPILFLFCVPVLNAQGLPDDMSMAIMKKGNEKAKIKLVQGDKTWEFEEGEWDKVPEAASRYIRSLFRARPTDRPGGRENPPVRPGMPAGPRTEIPELKVEIDCSDSPESKAWAEKAEKLAKEWYPKLINMLDSDGFRPTESLKLVFKKMDGVAYASGNTITISAAWIEKNPGDLGMVVHELTHVIQAYRGRNPGWVVEGIADYIRFFQYEPGNVATRVNPDRNKYTDSYRVTACFFDWIVENKEKDFIKKMNDVCRSGRYSNENTFKDITGKTVDELWEEYAESLRTARGRR